MTDAGRNVPRMDSTEPSVSTNGATPATSLVGQGIAGRSRRRPMTAAARTRRLADLKPYTDYHHEQRLSGRWGGK